MSIAVDILLGCTACGKGQVGRYLAGRLGAEIISVDSMKVYRGMDIGTAKPSLQARQEVRHHLIDVVEPSASFSVARFLREADAAIAEIVRRGNRPLAVGGTALYLKALIEGLFEGPSADPELRQRINREAQAVGPAALHARLARVDPAAAARIHPNDLRRIERALEIYELTGRPISAFQQQAGHRRPGYTFRLIGLSRDREDLARRINQRVRRMVEQGLIEEVRGLLGPDRAPLSHQAGQAVGYREVIDYLEGRVSRTKAVEQIKINTRKLAKSQRTWFRRFAGVQWVAVAPNDPAERVADRVLPLIAEPAGV